MNERFKKIEKLTKNNLSKLSGLIFHKSADENNMKRQLINDLMQVHDELQQTRNYFDLVNDLDLIESCIYQMESLETKYNYLLKEARKKGIQCHSYLTPLSVT